MKYITLLLTLVAVGSAGFLYGPAGMPPLGSFTDLILSGYLDADSVNTNHLVVNTTAALGAAISADSGCTVDFPTNLFVVGAATTADQDITLRWAESDANHDIDWDDGRAAFLTDEVWHADVLSSGVEYGSSNYVKYGAAVIETHGYSAAMLVDVNDGGVGTLKLGNAESDTVLIQSADFIKFDSAPLFAEISTPTARANYGAVYTKSDNSLYFQSGDGIEHIVNVNSTDYGEMGNIYGEDATEAMAIANVWYGMYHANINVGLISGFTYTDGSVGAGNITTAQAGAGINIADAAHGLVDGDIIAVQSANHAGVDTVTYVDAGNFEITIAYVGDEAGTWQEGSYLQCATTGQYRGIWTACLTQSLANAQTTTISPFTNTTQSTKATAIKYLSNTNDTAAPSGNGIMNFTAGDRIWFAIQSTAPQTITFKVRNVSID